MPERNAELSPALIIGLIEEGDVGHVKELRDDCDDGVAGVCGGLSQAVMACRRTLQVVAAGIYPLAARLGTR